MVIGGGLLWHGNSLVATNLQTFLEAFTLRNVGDRLEFRHMLWYALVMCRGRHRAVRGEFYSIWIHLREGLCVCGG